MSLCLVCNRELKDPLSIQLGVGPTCRKKRPEALTQGRLFDDRSEVEALIQQQDPQPN